MSRLILNITFIYIVEVITCLLIIGKIFQIAKLYRQSNASHLVVKKRNIKTSPPSLTREPKIINTKGIYNRFKENYSQHNLPLPEVSFAEGLPLPEVSFSSSDEGLHFATKNQQSEHKTILNNYIEDFFFESAPKIVHEADVVQIKDYKLDSNAEDEFITVADEHAEIVRAFESLEKNVCLVR